MFYLDVAKVDLVLHVASILSGCYICCTGYTRMLQVYVFKCFNCFKHMLQVFYLDVAFVVVAIHVYVVSVCFKCFSCFKCMW
jgi:hypothetical protein